MTKKNDELENENQIEIEILKEEIEKLNKKMDKIKTSKSNIGNNDSVLDENAEFMKLADACVKYDTRMNHIKTMSYSAPNGENFPLFYLKQMKTKAFLRMCELAEKEGITSRKKPKFGIVSEEGKKNMNAHAGKEERYEPKSSGGSKNV
jgi:hypothetical protein